MTRRLVFEKCVGWKVGTHQYLGTTVREGRQRLTASDGGWRFLFDGKAANLEPLRPLRDEERANHARWPLWPLWPTGEAGTACLRALW
jgi:hypothetical protein